MLMPRFDAFRWRPALPMLVLSGEMCNEGEGAEQTTAMTAGSLRLMTLRGY
jgi:hypothetical protein